MNLTFLPSPAAKSCDLSREAVEGIVCSTDEDPLTSFRSPLCFAKAMQSK